MSVVSITTITLGLLIFLIGYWYLGKSTGLKECTNPIDTYGLNYGGGITCIVLGITLIVSGIIYYFRYMTYETSVQQ